MRGEVPVNMQPGDFLGSEHVNRLSAGYMKMERVNIGGMSGQHTGSSLSFSPALHQHLRVAVIKAVVAQNADETTPGDTADSGLYNIQLRHYIHATGEWVTEGDEIWLMDERGVNTPPSYAIGDLLIVYFDEIRGAYVPASGAVSGGIYEGKLDADLAYNDTTGVTVSIWSGNPQVDTGDNVDNVLPLMVMTSGTLSEGDPVVIQKISGRWRVTHAEC